MKKMSKKSIILLIIIAIIIIAGISVVSTIGFNFDLRFKETKKIELYLEKEFEISDIKSITDEVMPNEEVMIQKIEVYEDSVSIIAKDITEEQKENLINKVNEKYETEISVEDTETTIIPHTRGRDLIKPYIMSFIIATIIILIYMAIRYYKLGMMKIIIKTVCNIVLIQILLFSAIAISRLPIGRLTMPMIVVAYMLTLVGLTTKFEKQLKDKKEEKEEK